MEKFILVILALLMISCQKTEIVGFHDKPVVESYLIADSIATVKISKLVPFDTGMEFSDMDVNKLEVTISEQSTGTKYNLSPLGDGIYKNKNLIIAAGKSYLLSFPYNGVLVTASTTVPAKPKEVKFSALSLTIPQMGDPGSGGSFEPPKMASPIDVAWTNDDQSYYLLVVKNIELNKVTINAKNNGAADFMRIQPTITNQAQLNPQSFKYYGWHQVILYKIQPEYVLFFQQTSNSSLSLTEINANISNGYGIFTGMNSYSVNLLIAP
jgi:hypothetical protein